MSSVVAQTASATCSRRRRSAPPSHSRLSRARVASLASATSPSSASATSSTLCCCSSSSVAAPSVASAALEEPLTCRPPPAAKALARPQANTEVCRPACTAGPFTPAAWAARRRGASGWPRSAACMYHLRRRACTPSGCLPLASSSPAAASGLMPSMSPNHSGAQLLPAAAAARRALSMRGRSGSPAAPPTSTASARCSSRGVLEKVRHISAGETMTSTCCRICRISCASSRTPAVRSSRALPDDGCNQGSSAS
mmetsp:Transcript_33784/g.105358  ORF Transcript_33784/g.105358 Transcript_33784/m.105358 type:complete len:254 (-) Transcript_33784:62-823(-)